MQVDRQFSHWTQHQGRCRRFLLRAYNRECWRSPRLRAVPYAVSPAYTWHIRKILAFIAMPMIAQWTLFTPATQVFLGKTSTSAEINLCLQLRHSSGMLAHEVKELGSIQSKDDTSLHINHKNIPYGSYCQFSKTLPLQPRQVSAHLTLAFWVTASIAIIWKARGSWPQKNCGFSTERDSTSLQNTDWLCIRPRFGLIWSIVLISGLMHLSISLTHLTAYNVKSFESFAWLSMKDLTLWVCVETSPRYAFFFTAAFIMRSVLRNCLTWYRVCEYATNSNTIRFI